MQGLNTQVLLFSSFGAGQKSETWTRGTSQAEEWYGFEKVSSTTC